MQTMKTATSVEIISRVPAPVAVAGFSLFGYPLSDWVQVLALLWLVLQISYFLYTKLLKAQQDDKSDK
jgi:hypothetical protein